MSHGTHFFAVLTSMFGKSMGGVEVCSHAQFLVSNVRQNTNSFQQ
jgi:hypothetical protein